MAFAITVAIIATLAVIAIFCTIMSFVTGEYKHKQRRRNSAYNEQMHINMTMRNLDYFNNPVVNYLKETETKKSSLD